MGLDVHITAVNCFLCVSESQEQEPQSRETVSPMCLKSQEQEPQRTNLKKAPLREGPNSNKLPLLGTMKLIARKIVVC